MSYKFLLFSIIISSLSSCGVDTNTQKQSALLAVGHEFIIEDNDGKNIKPIKKSLHIMLGESFEIHADWSYNSQSQLSEIMVLSNKDLERESPTISRYTYDSVGRLITEVMTSGSSHSEDRLSYKDGSYEPSRRERFSNGVLFETIENTFSPQGLLTTRIQKRLENGKTTSETITQCQLKDKNTLVCTEKDALKTSPLASEETTELTIVRVENRLSRSYQNQPAGTSMLRLYPTEIKKTQNGFVLNKTIMSYNEKWNLLEKTSTERSADSAGESVSTMKSAYDSSGHNRLSTDYETQFLGQEGQKQKETFFYE